MKMKKVITGIIFTIIVSSMSIPIFAAPTAIEGTSDIDIPSIIGDESEGISDIENNAAVNSNSATLSTVNSSEINDDIDYTDSTDGEIIDIGNLSDSEENNCQITLRADLPEGFDALVYVNLRNTDTGKIYMYNLYAVNNYSERGNIPDGQYTVTDIGVKDDTDSNFLFNTVDDFTLTYGEVKTLTVSLQNEEDVISLIESRTGEDIDNSDVDKDETVYTESDYSVVHTGTGEGTVAIVGNAAQAMKIFIKIDSTGGAGEGSFSISFDDGATWYAEDVKIPLSNIYEIEDAGLEIVFETSKRNVDNQVVYGEFLEGDTYRSVIHDPNRYIIYSASGSVAMEIIDTADADANPYDTMEKYGISSINVNILKAGILGEAVANYTLNGMDISDQFIIPENGIINIPDTDLALTFSGKGVLNFSVKKPFSATLYVKKKVNIIPLILLFLIGGVVSGMAIFMFFKKQIIPDSAYNIHEYEPVKAFTNKENEISENKSQKKKRMR